MLTKSERVLQLLIECDDPIGVVSRVSALIDDHAQMMHNAGFETVYARHDELITGDGREIVWVRGSSWALRQDIHAQRLAEALEQAKQRDAVIQSQNNVAAASNQPTSCASLIDGQLCGGSLSAASVCPRCALGKQGVSQIMTCDVCGAQTAVMR